MRLIDHLLNRVTMYRLVEYVLIGWIGFAAVLSFANGLAFRSYALLFSTAFILFVEAKFSNVGELHLYNNSSAIFL